MDEDKLLAKFKSLNLPGPAMPHRPDYGTLGQQVEILANYFKLGMKENLVLYCYDIRVTAVVKDKGEKLPDPKGEKLKQIIRLMYEANEFSHRKRHTATDFQQRLVSMHLLPKAIQNFDVKYFHEADDSAQDNAQTYHLQISPSQVFPKLSVSDLMAFLGDTMEPSQYPANLFMVQALNTLIRHHTIYSLTTSMIGGKGAFPRLTPTSDLSGGLEALRGYFSSVRLASLRPLINVNLTHGSFYKAIPLHRLMENYGAQDYGSLERFVKGLKVLTKYKKDGQGRTIPTTRTISGFANKSDGSGQFPPPIIDEYAGSPFQVWFPLKANEIAKLISDKFAKICAKGEGKADASSNGSKQRELLRQLKKKRPNYITVCEYFGESMFIASLGSVHLLTSDRV